MFKPHPQEFFLSEMESLAASVGKEVGEVNFVIEETAVDGVAGHTLSLEGQTPAPTETQEPAPAAEGVVEGEPTPSN